MKAVPMNEEQGGYQHLTGFDRHQYDWSSADEWEKTNKAKKDAEKYDTEEERAAFWVRILIAFGGGSGDPKGVILMNDGRILKNDNSSNCVFVYHYIDASYHYIGDVGGRIDANEIFSNLLAKNVLRAIAITNPIAFKNLVKNKGEWDLKNNMKTIYGLANHYDKENNSTTEFVYKNYSYTAEDLGNYHYGATGSATWFGTEELLLKQAGDAQMAARTSIPEWQKYEMKETIRETPSGQIIRVKVSVRMPPYGDDPHDQEMISRGYHFL